MGNIDNELHCSANRHPVNVVSKHKYNTIRKSEKRDRNSQLKSMLLTAETTIYRVAICPASSGNMSVISQEGRVG